MIAFINSWQGLHPLVIHFPIALLFVAPVLVLVAMMMRGGGRVMNSAALVVMSIGTLATYLALATGDAAGEGAAKTAAISGVLERHEELAEATSVAFSILTALFALMLVGPVVLRKPLPRRATVLASSAFLALYALGLGLLSTAAHQGGRLVHEFGVHAQI
jgi:uncharacterized membrane protein